MAKRDKPTAAEESGPDVVLTHGVLPPTPLPVCNAMVICDRVIFDKKDNTVSVIRIVDTVTLPTEGPLKRGENLELPALWLLILLRNAEASGSFKALLVSKGPSGKSEPIGFCEVTIDGEPQASITINVPVRLQWEGPGLYWIELMIGTTSLARSPLLIHVDQQTQG